jgi:predicted dehydrogenase
MSFDAVETTAAPIEVHGDAGSLAVPDPNLFEGTVRLFPLGANGWVELPVSAGYRDSGRGFGLADFAGTAPDAEPRASGRLAFHVLDVLESVLRSAASGSVERVGSTVERPAAVPLG